MHRPGWSSALDALEEVGGFDTRSIELPQMFEIWSIDCRIRPLDDRFPIDFVVCSIDVRSMLVGLSIDTR